MLRTGLGVLCGATILSAMVCTASVHAGGPPPASLPIDDGELVTTSLPFGQCGSAGGYGMDPSGRAVILYDARLPPPSGPVPAPGAEWNAPSFSHPTWTPSNLGAVFGLALDGEPQPNIYAAATTVYGNFAAQGAQCPQVPNGFGPDGPGAIYKLNGVSGAINSWVITGPGSVGTNQMPNTGVGLGNVCYDTDNNQFFATNFEDGRIYRIDTNGVIQSVIDPFAPDSGNPGFAKLGERLWGINYYDGRVYFSVWLRDIGRPNEPWNPNAGPVPPNPNNSIWSIALDGSGEFLGAEQLEIVLPYLDPGNPSYRYSNPVSDISFSPDGKLLAAEHAMFADYGQIDLGHSARVLEYVNTAGWSPSGTEYWIGSLQGGPNNEPMNSSGGIDYDCDLNVWSTGDVLLFGPTVYGLQRVPLIGNTTSTSASTSYHIDVTQAVKGGVGDVEVHVAEPCETFSLCGQDQTGPCNQVHPLPGCNDPDCCEIVCNIDPFCCSVTWDITCVALASEKCDQPLTGACCYQVKGTPFFECVENTTEIECMEFPNPAFFPNLTCDDLGQECPGAPKQGACCFINAAGEAACIDTVAQECKVIQGSTFFPGLTCNDPFVIEECELGGDCVDPPANMRAWWTLDELGGPALDSVAFNDGTWIGNPIPVAGKVDGALQFNQFDGAVDFVHVPDHPALNFGTGDFSIDAWVRTEQADGVRILVDKRAQEATGTRGYSLFLFNGQLGFQIADGNGSSTCAPCPTTASCSNYITGPAIDDGQWHHVAVTVDRDDPNGIVLYVDGNAAGNFDPTCHPDSVTNAGPLRLASRSFSVTALLNGSLDEVELFARALSPNEVAALYQADSAGKCKDECHTPWDTSYCVNENTVDITVQICNNSSVAHTYIVNVVGIAAGGSCSPEALCNVAGPLPFSLLPTNVAPNDCQDVTVTIPRPAGLNSAGDVACYEIVVDNLDTGTQARCCGTLRYSPLLCVEPFPFPGGPIVVGEPIDIIFNFTNTSGGGAPGGPIDTFEYVIDAMPSDLDGPDLISLDGLPPGEPVVRKITAPPGKSGEVVVQVEALEFEPFEFYDVIFHSDIDGDGAPDALASIGFQLAAPEPCAEDLAGNDGVVNVSDLLTLLSNWGSCGDPCPPTCPADINADCAVNVGDLLALLSAWGSCD